ncbi:MAG: HU family DNA-binding protein [Pseudomonadota bacterium]
MGKPETITKEKVAEKLKEKLGLSATLCEEIATHTFSEIFHLTKRDDKTMLQNFGTWKINHKKTRPGFNIRSGERVEIKPRTVLRFLPSRPLKEKINS